MEINGTMNEQCPKASKPHPRQTVSKLEFAWGFLVLVRVISWIARSRGHKR